MGILDWPIINKTSSFRLDPKTRISLVEIMVYFNGFTNQK